MILRAALLIPLFLGFCTDETLTGYGAADQVFVLQSIDDAPFPASATITFPAEGAIAGTGPCNSFTATQQVPYPWFKAGPIAASKRACPDLDAEALYFKSLTQMTLSEVSGPNLILSTADGAKMIFLAQ